MSKWDKRLECHYRTIYFLVDDEMNHVYVGQTKRGLKTRFREHSHGDCEHTKDLIKPSIIGIETRLITEFEAYALELIWIRILLENGFNVINGEADIRNSKKIFDYHLPKYEERKDVDIYELCNNTEFKIQNE